MKKVLVMGLLMLLLNGCSSQEVFETLGDEYTPVMLPAAGQISLHLPDEQAQMVIQNENMDIIYLYGDYSVSVQTMYSRSLEQTLKTVTGYSLEELTVMQTIADGCERYQCVWSCAGEGGDQVGRVCILDDGNYHYVVSAMAPAAQAGELTDVWQNMMDSFDIF